jgi:uncharacterized membrane-anchored protein YjiN (DUF445 family)
MGEGKRNRLGGLSLAAAVVGFLLVELQPWLRLSSVAIIGSLSLKGLFEAFFEASMAGAFADWFAVSALFKDPLGIHLPHTNILAKNKDTIAAAVPRFLSGFVSAEGLARELGRIDYASKAAELLAAGSPREEFHRFLREKAAEILSAYGGPDEAKAAALGRVAGELLDFLAERVDAPSAVSSLLALARRERLDHRAIEALSDYARGEIGRNRAKLVSLLTPMVKRNAGWQGLFIGSGTVERFLSGMQDELGEVKADKSNPIRLFVLSAISGYATKLERGDTKLERGAAEAGASVERAGENSGERERLAAAFADVLASEGFRSGFVRFAGFLLARLGEDLSNPEGSLIPTLQRLEEALLARLRGDAELRSRLNSIAASLLSGIIERGRLIEGVTEYLAGLLRSTDERYFVARIEESVWNDLQYIRVNGAVVGGVVGLAVAVLRAALGA